MDWTCQMCTTHIHCSSVPHLLSPCVGPGQVPTPGGLSPPASTGGAAQTNSQAGVTGNACCLVGEGGEGQPYCKKATVKALKLATYTTPTPVAIAILDHC